MTLSHAYEQYPQHTLEFDENRVHVRVSVGTTVVAETNQGLRLREGRYPVTVYVPREDVRMETLARAAQSTHCPFKGDASYFDFTGHAETSDNGSVTGNKQGVAEIAWSYEDPFDQMAALRDHLAFYTDRVQIEFLTD